MERRLAAILAADAVGYRGRSVVGTLAACIVLFTLEAVADPRASKDPGYRLSVYQEVADDRDS